LVIRAKRCRLRFRAWIIGSGTNGLRRMGQRNTYVTTSRVFRSQALPNTLLEIGSDRVLFSVDSPCEDADELTPWFDSCPIFPKLPSSLVGIEAYFQVTEPSAVF